MAFDLFFGEDGRDAIGHHEEFIFPLAQADEARYPELVALARELYGDPRIPAARANRLVHELIELLVSNGGAGNKPLTTVVLRLASFFGAAHRTDQDIRCRSD